MNKMLIVALGLAAASMTTGCKTVYKVSETAEPVASSQIVATRTPVANVVARAPGEGARGLARGMRTAVANSLSARGFDVAAGGSGAHGAPDATVSLEVSREEVARLDEWRAYKGTVNVRVEESAAGRFVAAQTFAVTGERALDETKAMEGVVCGLSGAVCEWLAGVLEPVQIEMPPPPAPRQFSSLVSICPADAATDPGEALRMQGLFAKAVSAQKGVVSCRLVNEVAAERRYVYRVEYDPEAFPGGLLNTIVLENPDFAGGVELQIVH